MSKKSRFASSGLLKQANYIFDLSMESDRAAAVLAVARFEEWLLHEAIMKGVFNVDRNRTKTLKLNRPLMHFPARINLAFLLQLIDEETLMGLRLVQEIRNEFAHKAEVKNFSSRTVALKVAKLPGYPTKAQEIATAIGEEDVKSILKGVVLRNTYTDFLDQVRERIHRNLDKN